MLILISPTPISQPNSPGSSTKPTKLKFVCVCVYVCTWSDELHMFTSSFIQSLKDYVTLSTASVHRFGYFFNFWSQRNLKTFV